MSNPGGKQGKGGKKKGRRERKKKTNKQTNKQPKPTLVIRSTEREQGDPLRSRHKLPKDIFPIN